MAAKVAGEFQERDVLFAHIVKDADGGDFLRSQSDYLPPGAAQLSLQRLRLNDRRVEMLLEQVCQNIHELWPGLGNVPTKDTILIPARWKTGGTVLVSGRSFAPPEERLRSG